MKWPAGVVAWMDEGRSVDVNGSRKRPAINTYSVTGAFIDRRTVEPIDNRTWNAADDKCLYHIGARPAR